MLQSRKMLKLKAQMGITLDCRYKAIKLHSTLTTRKKFIVRVALWSLPNCVCHLVTKKSTHCVHRVVV